MEQVETSSLCGPTIVILSLRRNCKANALTVVLAVLMLVATLGTHFTRNAILERKTATNFANLIMGNALAQAGVDYAIAKLRQNYSAGPIIVAPKISNGFATPQWMYYRSDSLDETISSEPLNDPAKIAEDYIGAGDPVDEMYENSSAYHPSFAKLVSERKVSGVIGTGARYVYTLKIFDTSSQINLNSHINPDNPADPDYPHYYLADLLNNLSKAIALREPYKSEKVDTGYDPTGVGPLRGLGAEIVTYRNASSGFASKFAIIGVTDGVNTIVNEDLRYVWDYITVYPSPQEMKSSGVYQNIRPDSGDETYQIDYRCPININTASWPVLVATLTDLHLFDTADSKRVTFVNAKVLANKICRRRSRTPFTNWDDFYRFVENQKTVDNSSSDSENETGALAGEYPARTPLTRPYSAQELSKIDNVNTKIAVIKANCDPNVLLRSHNNVYQIYNDINKTDFGEPGPPAGVPLAGNGAGHYTTEFCFYPLGRFAITSLGQILAADASPLTSVRHYAVVKIFDVERHTVQRDFEQGVLQRTLAEDGYDTTDASTFWSSDATGRMGNFHSISYVNNLYNQNPNPNVDFLDMTSESFGYIQPFATDLPVDNPSGSGFDSAGNLLFKLNFNNSLVADIATPQITTNENPVLANGGTLTIDGMVFTATETDELNYYSRQGADTTADYNFPAMEDALGYGSANSGAIMFWFKLGQDWLVDEWRTVLFATTWYTHIGTGYQVGVQRIAQMRVTGPDTDLNANSIDTATDPVHPLLRALEIQVRAKFFCYDGAVAKNIGAAPPTGTPYSEVDYGTRYALLPTGEVDGASVEHQNGVHAKEWYHVVLLWQDGVELAGFAGTFGDTAVVVSGNFYDHSDQLARSGPLFNASPSTTHWDHLDDGITYLKSDTTPLTNITYDISLPDSDFAALDTGKKDNNYLYIGYVPGMGSTPDITIDDVRIATVTDDANLKPSRFPAPVDRLYGRFKSKFIAPAAGDEILAVYPGVRKYVPGYVNSSLPANWTQVDDYALPDTEWQQLWIDMTGQDPAPGDLLTRLADTVTQIRIQVEHSGTWEKNSLIDLSTTYLDYQTGPVPLVEQLQYVFSPCSGQTLAYYLVSWYRWRNNGVAPTQLNNYGDELNVVISYNPTTFTYNLDFQTPSAFTAPIFQSPVVDSLTLFYRQQIHYDIYLNRM